jgi:hypothetical protein
MAECLQVYACYGVRISGVPAGIFDVVVEGVPDIPAEHHVAEAGARFDDGIKLLYAEPLAAQGAVNIHGGDFDAPDFLLTEFLANVAEVNHRATQTDLTLVY